ncbi:MAG: PAS domain-containing sensor histidine kinase, partial [Desulfobacteraceae bacterium]|nr:PAS domain-containing sensor histidine kinase [Desulfobacteraceae bacterium]
MNREIESIENDFKRPPLNLAIMGGGKDCKFFLEFLLREKFQFMNINLVGVCDINPNAEGFRLAKEMGIYTTDSFHDLLKIKDLDGVIEITDDREVLLELIRHRPKGVAVLDHNVSRIVATLFDFDRRLKSAERQVELERRATAFLIQQTNERIVVLNPDFTIVEANEAYLNAVTRSKQEVIGAHCYEITHGLNAPCT